MRTMLLALLVAGCAHHTTTNTKPAPPSSSGRETEATPPAHPHGPMAPAELARLLPGLGSYHRAVSTRSPEAQQFFDQGLRLVYAFNHDEAQRSFAEAARRDPSCAMCWWGQALVLGPNINLPTAPDKVKAARALVARAAAAPNASPVERALIAALAKRYADPPPADPAAQARYDQAYADAMRAVAQQFADDDDVQVLFAESLMDLHPWRLWLPEGKPNVGTEEIVATLERVLARNPQHPGANHYYIHAVEASPHPERALAAAGRVARLMPGAGHIVHMPSHVFERVGRYNDAVEANRRAIAADQKYLQLVPDPGAYAMYVAHNHQFLWAAAMMAGRGDDAVKAARAMVASVPAEMFKQMPEMSFVLPAPALALTRFGRWQEVLAEPAPPPGLPLATIMYTYARARAHAALGQYDEADKDVAALSQQAAALPKDAVVAVGQSGPVFAGIARDVAAGDLACRRGDYKTGIAKLRAAVAGEDSLGYDEPPDWYYPVRHTLGACLLRARQPAQAERVYRDDLRRNPDNGWSLTGLRAALHAQHKPTKDIDTRLNSAWSASDAKIEASDF